MTIENSNLTENVADEGTPVLVNEDSANDSNCIPTKRTVAGVVATIGVAATTGAIGGATGYGLWKLCTLGGVLTSPSAPAATWIGCGAASCGGFGGVFTGLSFFGKQPNNPQSDMTTPVTAPTPGVMRE